ncbi:sec-independent protein translocase protein TatC [Glaciihabitans tibetensis]|uniref:Sec-independent protein translocase protein TatC n=2 Tax=Glaciihabitans tibetensis TaxID=1266600 RepID=A0A2T0VK31_9MICO|nr:twin-arginine translocase subunit TatC [Glaciihabitans tibetensis]PRY70543.1 sec-independent protein translocase protein TatC [Glaciihabitans tibetensis]
MSFGAHLIELRNRLFRAALAIVVASVVGYFLVPFVLDALQVPLKQISESTGRTAVLNNTRLTEAFDVQLQITVILGIVISSPVWLYQIWAYIVPALKRTEKRYAAGFLGATIPLFLAGCATGWFIFPHTVELLAGFAPDDSTSIFGTKDFVDFVSRLVLAVGIGFVLPVFLVLLNFIGVLSAASILKGWRIAVLAITLFSALATPPSDVMTMFLLAIPMLMLYLLAAGVAWLHDRAAARKLRSLIEESTI